jgi:hypothetical protein
MFESGAVMYGHLEREIDELFAAVQLDANDEFFCHYDKKNVDQIRFVEDGWSDVFAAYPGAKPEIIAGVDCFALGHNAACVFHMCRVAEIGLRAIGRERGVELAKSAQWIEYATWGAILGAIEPEVEKIRKKRRGPVRDEALKFYDSILSDLRAILNLYRDPSMHFRDSYNDGEASGAIFRVKSLMKALSSKLSEDDEEPISWALD